MFIVEIVTLVAELLLNHTFYLQVLTIPLILFCLYRILKHKEDKDKFVESSIVAAQLSGLIPGDEEAKVVADEYFIITPNEAYLKTKRFMLVVLSNGKVYRYEVESAEKNGFVLNMNASLCEDKQELELVKKHTSKLTKEDSAAKVKRKFSIAAACVLVFGMLFIGLIIWLSETMAWMRSVGWAVAAVFVLSLVLSLALSSFEGKKSFFGTVFLVASWVLGMSWLLVQLIFPALLLLVGFMFIIMFPFAMVFIALRAICALTVINPQTILFFSLSAGAIISAYYSKPLFSWLSRILTSNGHRYEKYFQDIVEYVYQPSNIQFVIHLLYFMYLVVSTTHRLQIDGVPLFGNGWDLAVLESFLVFIAFSNMKKKRVGTAFSFSVLFGMMWGMWTTHDYIEEKGKDFPDD
ncbi:hypothetical protein SAMN06298215_1519 [Bacteroidales bacterium WCE2008]|nr:hypothetical protein SAMN06298215_1519 [Bacteroidales bacterium WCE2008]